MVIGKQWFISPSDSLAIVAANATVIPYFKDGVKVHCLCTVECIGCGSFDAYLLCS